MVRKIFLSCFCLITCANAFAQSSTDTAFIGLSVHNTVELYRQGIGVQARLYNGSKYEMPEHTLEEHPFFVSEDWINGDVFYDGELFQNVPLMYDLSTSHLIAEHASSGHAIQLISGKLQRFTVAGHYFEKIENESVGGTLPGSGFYDILYPGETKVVARRQKFLREQIVSTLVEKSFEERNRYFLFKNGVFFSIKSRGSVIKLMRDKKAEMKKFARQHRVAFTGNRDLMLKSLAEYYDTLK